LSEEQLTVGRIKDGTVIDHCEPGSALRFLVALGIKEGCTNLVTVAMNVPSRRLGKKDIVKIADRFLTQSEANRIALISPCVTINLIRDYKVIDKRKVELPDAFVNIFKCPNPACIANSNEPITPLTLSTAEAGRFLHTASSTLRGTLVLAFTPSLLGGCLQWVCHHPVNAASTEAAHISLPPYEDSTPTLEPPSLNSVQSLIRAFGHPDHIREQAAQHKILGQIYLSLPTAHPTVKTVGFLVEFNVRSKPSRLMCKYFSRFFDVDELVLT
jgi:aspartate carbamoyltransferase regulatory subunit